MHRAFDVHLPTGGVWGADTGCSTILLTCHKLVATYRVNALQRRLVTRKQSHQLLRRCSLRIDCLSSSHYETVSSVASICCLDPRWRVASQASDIIPEAIYLASVVQSLTPGSPLDHYEVLKTTSLYRLSGWMGSISQKRGYAP